VEKVRGRRHRLGDLKEDSPVEIRNPVTPELRPDERQSRPTIKETVAPTMSLRSSSQRSRPSS